MNLKLLAHIEFLSQNLQHFICQISKISLNRLSLEFHHNNLNTVKQSINACYFLSQLLHHTFLFQYCIFKLLYSDNLFDSKLPLAFHFSCHLSRLILFKYCIQSPIIYRKVHLKQSKGKNHILESKIPRYSCVFPSFQKLEQSRNQHTIFAVK